MLLRKLLHYCRRALTAASIIVKRQMGGGQGCCALQLFRGTRPAGEAREGLLSPLLPQDCMAEPFLARMKPFQLGTHPAGVGWGWWRWGWGNKA